MPEPTITELIEKKFYSSKKFTEEIEKTVLKNKDMKYIDAIVFFWSGLQPLLFFNMLPAWQCVVIWCCPSHLVLFSDAALAI